LVKGIAGLGDRMQCVLTGILYARLTGRQVLVDWTDHYYSNDGQNAFHHLFQCSLCDPKNEIPLTDSVAPAIWRGNLRDSAWSMRRRYGDMNDSDTWRQFSIELEKLDYQEDVLVMWTYMEKVDLLRNHFTGPFEEWAHASTPAILRRLLQEDLLLQPGIWKRIDEFKSANFTRPTVGVHVRYTDHRSRLWAILHQLNKLFKRHPDLQVFLSTDNLQIKNMFEESYPAVISTAHWYGPIPGLALHTDRNRPDPIENGIEALVDLYLLGQCDYLIIDRSSSFAYVARLLTNAPDAAVFDVGRYGKPPARFRRFMHRAMLRSGVFSWGLRGLTKFLKMKNRRLLAGRTGNRR
jgi:hypothetical protein